VRRQRRRGSSGGRGTGGFFDGSYFSSAEGGIRTPVPDPLARPQSRPAPKATKMVHVTDMFTTLLKIYRLRAAKDRLIDGVDQGRSFSANSQPPIANPASSG